MKRKKILVFVMACLLVFLTAAANAQTKKLRSIGTYTFVKIRGSVPTQEVMRTLLDKYAGDVKMGFEMAGYPELALPFLEQIKTATIEDKALPVGDKMMWMLFRSGGRIKVVKDIEWAGARPLEVFSFFVVKDNVRYEFVIPKPCGNISLRGMERAAVPIPDALCRIAVAPPKVNIKGSVTVDMSGSQNAKSMEVDLFGPDNIKITTKTLTPESPRWQVTLDNPGNYVFKGRAANANAKISENPCEAKAYVNFPPVAKLWTSCLPCKDYVGKPITFDATGSTDVDGQVVRADFEIADAQGNLVDRYSDTQTPFTWDKIFKKAGVYAVTCVVTDDMGAVSEPVRIVFEVTEKRGFFLVEAGPLFAKGSHGPYLAGKIGFVYRITPGVLDFIIAGGGGMALKGEPWKSFLMADLLLNVHAGKAFFGAGFGLATKVRENHAGDAELVGNIGVDIFDKYSSIGSIFFEGRGAIGKDRSFSNQHKLMLGFRMLF